MDGGIFPVWRGDGREIFFRDARGLYVAQVDGSGDSFEIESVSYLIDLPLRISAARQFDVAKDGQRFLVNEPYGEADISPVTLVQNWNVELPAP